MDTTDARTEAVSTQEFWDARYRAEEQVFSGAPNAALVRETADLVPGTALELGCGEGGDAVWLAQRGWTVTATDVSSVALRRAADRAEAAGVGDRIDWQRHDLAESFPEGTFDLVSSHFLYPPRPEGREPILRRAAGSVAPGGVLLIVSHAGMPPWESAPDPEFSFPTPEELLAALDLPAGRWEVLVSETYQRPVTDPEGRPATRPDSTLKLRRRTQD
ncbi:methyltransferase domain-containing protein [Streptomyces albus subsp. chlorinus]|uniref:SAM-dependent methyltransferase n=1 Tax=Streptomyces albus TaxID=1888 RepID=UPI00156EE148|nr:class I SAM-dependent methyltransferase [Streptomyces albus]NSC20196.1 methyltransferase domain-containing protein [Streptomyces albus subsp. chlorinus]